MREIDKQIAEKVYGKTAGWVDYPDMNYQKLFAFDGARISEIPDYSTDISAAYQIVEKLAREGYKIDVTTEFNPLSETDYLAIVVISKNWFELVTKTEESIPLAICKAVLGLEEYA